MGKATSFSFYIIVDPGQLFSFLLSEKFNVRFELIGVCFSMLEFGILLLQIF